MAAFFGTYLAWVFYASALVLTALSGYDLDRVIKYVSGRMGAARCGRMIGMIAGTMTKDEISRSKARER